MNVMSDSSHRFLVGFTKALERRKERTKQQTVQVQKIDKSVSDVVTSDAIITEQNHDELYRTTIIQKMISHIKSKRKPV
jgi:hypothetical protein